MEETQIVTLPYKGKHLMLKTDEAVQRYKPESKNTFIIRHKPFGLDERVAVGKKIQETGLAGLADQVAAAALRAKFVGGVIIHDWSQVTTGGVINQGTVDQLDNLPPDVLLRFSEILHNGHDMSEADEKALRA